MGPEGVYKSTQLLGVHRDPPQARNIQQETKIRAHQPSRDQKFCETTDGICFLLLGDDVATTSVTHRTLDLIPSRLPRHFSLLSLLSYTFDLFLTTGFVQLTFNIYTFHQKDEFHSTFSFWLLFVSLPFKR